MEGWVPMHGELRVLELTGWKAPDGFGELGVRDGCWSPVNRV